MFAVLSVAVTEREANVFLQLHVWPERLSEAAVHHIHTRPEETFIRLKEEEKNSLQPERTIKLGHLFAGEAVNMCI